MPETLEKVLIKWMKTISSTIKNDKISKYDMKPCRPSSKKDVKPDTDKDMKPDTDQDIKPDTDKDIKPNRPVNERESNTKKVTKKDVKLDIKHDIVRLDDKTKTNESQKTNKPQKTFINNESHLKKLVNNIKIILEYFVCEKFINEKFPTLRVSKDVILLHSKYEPKQGLKKICRIDLCRDIISLNIGKFVNNLKEDITLCIGGERITLKVSQRENHQRNRSKINVSISICNDKIINTTSITKNEESKNYTKDANEEIECTNQVRYIILRKIMHSLFKTCKKKK